MLKIVVDLFRLVVHLMHFVDFGLIPILVVYLDGFCMSQYIAARTLRIMLALHIFYGVEVTRTGLEIGLIAITEDDRLRMLGLIGAALNALCIGWLVFYKERRIQWYEERPIAEPLIHVI